MYVGPLNAYLSASGLFLFLIIIHHEIFLDYENPVAHIGTQTTRSCIHSLQVVEQGLFEH